MRQQYYRLKLPKRKLVNQISNIWLALFFVIEVRTGVLIAIALGFNIEELSSITKNTEIGMMLGLLTLMAVPLSAWLAWGIAAIPFLASGCLNIGELKNIMFKLRYPEYWLE